MANCKSCQAPIIWVKTSSGKNMPVDEKPESRFILDGRGEGNTPYATMIKAYVSHFATCPNADKHRKKEQ
jgi:hypothetical protein